MVATRRGGRVDSPTKTTNEKQPVVQATPSTARRTRSAQQDECPVQPTLAETCSQLEKPEGGPVETPAASTKRRCTRVSRIHSPKDPSTPVGSIHEGDTSDAESLCSVASDAVPPLTRTRLRSRQLREKDQDHEVSEVESSSSVVSPIKPGVRRSTRRKTSDEAKADGKREMPPETESCGSAMTDSQRVTRSQRRSALTRSSARRLAEDSELSEAESYASSASGRGPRRPIRPIPMHLEELSESSQSPTRTTRRTRATRGGAASTEEDDKKPSCDSEGFESGPKYSLSSSGRTRSAVSKAAGDSESEEVEVGSSTGSRGTPCSSRAGSGTSNRRAPTSRRSTKTSSAGLEKTEEPAEEESSLDDSKLESTVIGEDGDCTLVEEQKSQTSGDEESLDSAELTSSGAEDEKEKTKDVALPGSVCAGDISEPAVITEDLKEELSSENKAGEASEIEMMEETIPPSEPAQNLQSAPTTISQTDSKEIERVEKKQEAANIHPTQADEPPEEEDVEIQPRVEEKLDVHVTASQKVAISVESDSEQQSKDVVVQKTKTVSLLDSSDDEDGSDEEEEDLMSDEDDLGSREERRGEPSSVSEAASSSAVDGLFMIDTRPGQDADQQYYREEEDAADTVAEQEEEDDEFIDEDGDEDDDEDSKVLFLSRNPQLKELSSRIDPGLRVKELGGLYISFDGSKSKPVSSSLQKLKEKKSLDEVMKKSVIGPDFEKKHAVPPYSESKQALKLKRREERAKSTGDGWFNMKAPEISQELKGDLQLLKMRGSLDPKRFYKKNDRDGFPKYFQVGTVVDSPADFYHSRIPKKERKRTMVEELLNDAEFRHKNKKKYQQIIAEKAAQAAGKRNKKKKIFHKK